MIGLGKTIGKVLVSCLHISRKTIKKDVYRVVTTLQSRSPYKTFSYFLFSKYWFRAQRKTETSFYGVRQYDEDLRSGDANQKFPNRPNVLVQFFCLHVMQLSSLGMTRDSIDVRRVTL